MMLYVMFHVMFHVMCLAFYYYTLTVLAEKGFFQTIHIIVMLLEVVKSVSSNRAIVFLACFAVLKAALLLLALFKFGI